MKRILVLFLAAMMVLTAVNLACAEEETVGTHFEQVLLKKDH